MKTCPYSRLRHLLAATLLIGSTLQFVAPVLADGTPAGTSIKNTATGTFTDGAGTTYNTTSNEVTIDVSEIAGITLTAQAPSSPNPNAGDTLYVDFLITNTGNDPTQFFIPGTATLSNTAAFEQNGRIQIVQLNGADIAPVDVPTAGASTGTLLGNPTIPGTGTPGTVTVRVPIRVLPTATATSTLTVALGNTTPANAQNVSRVDNANDVYTLDNPNGAGGETNATTPANNVQEAMATSSQIVVAARLQAFAAVLKAVGGYNNQNTPDVLLGDILTYRLALRVENPTTPPTGLVTSDLFGTLLNVDNSTAKPYVLVSDAIPAGLQLTATAPISPSAQWIPVYTQDPLTTTALNARWVTVRPTSGAPVTRIGFIYDTTTTGLPKGTAGVGTTISGFQFDLTPTATFTGGQISNIAQVFGQSQPGAVVPGTSTQLVYDESGDQTSNDGLFGNNPDPNTGGASPANGGISDGRADATADGIDPGIGNDPTNTGNTNTGSTNDTDGGEATVYTIAATPLNGPKDKPAAIGPTSTNDDYSNKSVIVPPNLSPTTLLNDAQTPAFTFENTVQNTSGSPQAISLLPTPPATAGDLLDNTKVTITDPATGNTATYNYTAANGFTFATGTGATATSPVRITIAGGALASYQVIVDLPGDTPQLRGYPVPVTAFTDVNNDGSPTGDPSNITIDRLYTNYLSLVKQARILEADGVTPVSGPAGTFVATQADLSAAATPGRVIEYQITYRNISTGGGTDNAILPANNLVIVENGSTSPNTWFVSTFDPKFPTTGGNGSAVDANGTITVTSSGTPADIEEYRDTVTSVPPASPAGTFTFQRKIK